MVQTGFDKITSKLPSYLKNKSIALLCHAASINSSYQHITDFFLRQPNVKLKCILGPQHGLYGQTQDNMIEWEGEINSDSGIPIYSLYGKNRSPTAEMLAGVELFVVDLQDIGARPYTYIWTLKNSMIACKLLSIPLVVLDRPNPISALGFDGPVLKKEFYTFVGGAEIPLCHSLSIGEIAMFINETENINCELSVEWMQGWKRGMMFKDTGQPWVNPSPNMPTQETAIVYPGLVLAEALNLSEARGTCTPFELFGAPGLNTKDLIKSLKERNLQGCKFRLHDYIPTFHKYSGSYCNGVFIQVTNTKNFEPVFTAITIFDEILKTTPNYLSFNNPPYEYEYELLPFDILMGDSLTREALIEQSNLNIEKERWEAEINDFKRVFKKYSYYG